MHGTAGYGVRLAEPPAAPPPPPLPPKDLEACVWIEEHMKKFKRILLMVSHSQDFLNGVCTNIIHMHQKKLRYYSGRCAVVRCGGDQ